MKFFTVEVKNRVAIVSFSRPPVNAYSDESYQEMIEVFSGLNQRKDICAAVYYTPEKWFSPGNDVKDANEAPTWETQCKSADLIVRVLEKIRGVEVPVIAAVRGYCLGGALAFVGACDLVIASETTKFGMPEIKSGICMGWSWLQRFTSPQMARYMYYSGNPVPVQDLFHLGHILKVVKDDQLLETACQVAEEFANRAPTAIRLAKKAMTQTDTQGLADDLAVELICNQVFFQDHMDERVEALRSFLEKRPPNFYHE